MVINSDKLVIAPKKILYLYRELMPYNIEVLKELVAKNSQLIVVHDDVKKQTPYNPPEIKNATICRRSEFTYVKLLSMAFEFNPDLIYISDRTVSLYNKVAMALRKKKQIPVISGNDTPWRGGKQWFNVLTSVFRHKRYYSHMLVAGMRQFEYAKKLGFKNDRILFPLNSANLNVFLSLNISLDRFKGRNILFVGRFHRVKGLDLLIKAWSKVENKNGAKLYLVGHGELLNSINLPEDIIVIAFSNQEELLRIAERCRTLILPSRYEPWGLVIHEFAAAGMPIIATNVCGAVPHLLINQFNGLVIKPHSLIEIVTAINKIMDMDEFELKQWGENSRKLAISISPDMVSAAILSVL